MNKRTFRLISNDVRQRAIDHIWGSPDGYEAVIQEPTRNLAQNAVQWPILEKFAAQLKWPVNGQLTTLEPEEFKDILTAAFFGDTVRLAQGLNGGVVMLGKRTSKFRKKQFSEWIEFLHSVAADRGVKL